jgi:hypothetical protein
MRLPQVFSLVAEVETRDPYTSLMIPFQSMDAVPKSTHDPEEDPGDFHYDHPQTQTAVRRDCLFSGQYLSLVFLVLEPHLGETPTNAEPQLD